MQAGLLRRLVMAPALSGLCLTKVSGYSHVTATLWITVPDFLQGKYSHVCNCKWSFQQTGSWSCQKAGKAWHPKAIPCSAKAGGTEPAAPCPNHHIFPTALSTGRPSSDSTFRMQLSESKPRRCWTPPNSICGVHTQCEKKSWLWKSLMHLFSLFSWLPFSLSTRFNELELCHYKQVLN